MDIMTSKEEIKAEIDNTPQEIVYAKSRAGRQLITYNNPYGPGVTEIEYDDPVKIEQVNDIIKNLPKIFYEKDGKVLGIEEHIAEFEIKDPIVP